MIKFQVMPEINKYHPDILIILLLITEADTNDSNPLFHTDHT